MALLCAGEARGGAVSLWPTEVAALRRIARRDASAGKLLRAMQRRAARALREPPRPLPRIQTAGLLRSDPMKRRTRQALRDMPRVFALALRYALEKRPADRAKAEEILLAWAKTNQGAGQPIDDTNLEPLIEGYDLLRESLEKRVRAPVDRWLGQVAHALIAGIDPRRKTAINNWHSHRLKVIGLIGFATGADALRRYAQDGIRKQIERNLRADGSSFDFHHRDAVHYHAYDLEPLLRLAILLSPTGDLYRWVSPSGSSLRRSLRWLLPYARGEKTHAEFARSRSAFDRARSNAREPGHRAGEPFRPKRARGALELAQYFEPRLRRLVARLYRRKGARYPSWRVLVNEVTRRRGRPR
jgi:hypothetical protein